MAEAKRKLAAILAADVVGYSRLMADDERATVAALNASREIFKAHVSEHDGRVVDTAGDSVLATFDSVVEAVQCAGGIQTALGLQNQNLPDDRRMAFRIGVNLGDVIEQDDGTIYGDGVNVAARLESLAEAGGICLSASAHAQVEDKTDYRFEDLGEHEVKNIARPVRTYRVVIDGQAKPATPTTTPPLQDKPSIAVLPFDNMGGDPEQDYFADGITEDLITALSAMRWLAVTARNSTFIYKGQSPDINEVKDALGVRYILEGSVRRAAKRIRISVQLIDGIDGTHIWANRYDRELADIFDLQDEITLTIAGAIEPELAKEERERARRKPADNLDAWDLCQRGIGHLWRFTPENNAEAQQLFRQAIDMDPEFAAVYSHLAHSHYLAVVLGFTESPGKSAERVEEMAKQAIALDKKDAIAHYAYGRALSMRGDYAAALTEFRIALDLNPSSAIAHHGIGVALLFSGEAAQSIPAFEAAQRFSPFDPFVTGFEALKAGAYIALGDYEQAVDIGQMAVRRPNATLYAYANTACALGHLDRIEEARAMLDKALTLNPAFSRAWFERAVPNVHRTILDTYFDGLRKAGLDATKAS